MEWESKWKREEDKGVGVSLFAPAAAAASAVSAVSYYLFVAVMMEWWGRVTDRGMPVVFWEWDVWTFFFLLFFKFLFGCNRNVFFSLEFYNFIKLYLFFK